MHLLSGDELAITQAKMMSCLCVCQFEALQGEFPIHTHVEIRHATGEAVDDAG
jgi:hypothetical protein